MTSQFKSAMSGHNYQQLLSSITESKPRGEREMKKGAWGAMAEQADHWTQ
jgi:hypothetical protein